MKCMGDVCVKGSGIFLSPRTGTVSDDEEASGESGYLAECLEGAAQAVSLTK